MKTAYHQGYVPPFPQLTTIVEFDQTRLDPRPALVDSGADAAAPKSASFHPDFRTASVMCMTLLLRVCTRRSPRR